MRVFLIITLCLLINIKTIKSYIVDPGPQIKASIGEVWPKPYNVVKTKDFFILDPKNYIFKIVDYSCSILENALIRYKKIIENSLNSPIKHGFEFKNDDNNFVIKNVTEIFLNLTSPCEYMPHLKMDEWYYVSGNGRIISHSIWGMLRGLETFSQLLTPYDKNLLHIPDVRIRDSPRFPHRGLLLDTSRHFINLENIYKILDGMSYNKLNVFHWHIVDDQSFPYESITFPELAKGAYFPEQTYSQQNISDVIEYARLRGIRVLPEFDVPGHTRSWGISHPEILTECEEELTGKLGPINPINEKSYHFLEKLFKEIKEVFHDKFIHFGGDEVEFECWASNYDIRNYITKRNLSYSDLQRQFMERVTRFVDPEINTPIVWQEAMVKNVSMPKGTVVQVWTGDWRNLLKELTESGHRVLFSQCWYLDHLSTGGDWVKYYFCDPHDFYGTDEQKQLIIGGEACMWSEVVNNHNVLQRIFPRVSAAAERLWSRREITNRENAEKRIEEHTCRMILRGIDAQPPNGPGVC